MRIRLDPDEQVGTLASMCDYVCDVMACRVSEVHLPFDCENNMKQV